MAVGFAMRAAAAWVPSGASGVRAIRGGVRRLSVAAPEAPEAVLSRPSAAGVSLELRTLKDHAELVKAHVVARQGSAETVASVDRMVVLNEERAAAQRERDSALATRKKLSGEIGKAFKGGATEEDVAALKAEVAEAVATSEGAEARMDELQSEAEALFAALPNLLDDATPDGAGEEENAIVAEWGTELRKLGDEGDFLWHDELAQNLCGYDPEAASRVSGARFAVLRGGVARLERALGAFFLDLHTAGGEYEEVASPVLVARSALEGTGQLPKFEDDLFKIDNHKIRGEDAFLIPTAEVPLTNLLAGEVLEEAQLPIKLAALTNCFRAEAGSYGRDTRGLIRQHQFAKVELVKIVAPEDGLAEHHKLVADAEKCLQLLELPYRKVQLCSGDIGFSARQCFDFEVWLPGQQAYREISSCSLMGDYQARRMGLRYRPKPPPKDDANDGDGASKKKKKQAKPKPVFPYTMNGSGLAVGRALVAVLENHQNPDGSVTVPEALRPYMGGATKIEKPAK